MLEKWTLRRIYEVGLEPSDVQWLDEHDYSTAELADALTRLKDVGSVGPVYLYRRTSEGVDFVWWEETEPGVILKYDKNTHHVYTVSSYSVTEVDVIIN